MNEAQVFVVRVWRLAEAFRASVRAVGDEQALLFTQPLTLANFLAESVGTPPPQDEHPGGSDDDHP